MSYKSLLKIVTKQSEKIVKQVTSDYVQKIEGIARDWRRWVRKMLSVRYSGGKNTTLFPKLRTGQLRSSLIARRVQVAKRGVGDLRKNQFAVRVPVSWRRTGDNNYGEILNSSSAYEGRTFFGWKERVRDELNKRIQGRL